MQLGLGTAQFGLDYGVSNPRGRVRIDEIRKIFELASSAGISILDTAPSYGDSESSIGSALDGSADFRIVTKTPVFGGRTIDSGDAAVLSNSFEKSRAALRCDKLYGLLFHRADDLLKPGGKSLVDAALRLIDRGVLEKVGVSVYSGTQIDQVLELFSPGIVQVPVNVFDQRVLRSGHLAQLRSMGTEVHARSVFLQGLLLMDADRIPAYFDPFKSHIGRYFDAVSAAGRSKLQAALTFAMSIPADAVLIGVTCADELKEALRSPALPTATIDFAGLASEDPRLVDPSQWQLPSGTHVSPQTP